MKHLLTVILGLAVLVATVAGCGGAHRYDSRLAAADSLMRPDPDSALAIVKAVDRDSLATEGDRAYRDLLLTQARYRCYEAATSDSDINHALAWYRAHSGEREKLTRALIYKGAVMDELGHPDSAMLYYKQAEATADEKDYFNLGQINLRIADLYRRYYADTEICYGKYETALSYFKQTGDERLQQNCLFNMAGCLGITGRGNPLEYLNQAFELAVELNDSSLMFSCRELLSRQLSAKDSTRKEAKVVALECLKKYPAQVNIDLLLDLAYIYAKDRVSDSAEYYLDIVKDYVGNDHFGQIQTRMNSILAILAEYANDPVKSDYYTRQSKRNSDSIANNKNRYSIQHIESANNKTQSTHAKQEMNTLQLLIVSLALLFLVSVIIFLSYHYIRTKRFRAIISEMEHAHVDKHEKLLEQLNAKESLIGDCVQRMISFMLTSIETSEKDSPAAIRKRIKKTVSETVNDDFWNELRIFLDRKHDNIISKIAENTLITKKDIRFIELLCCGFTYIEIAVMMDYNPKYFSQKRTEIAKKLKIDVPLQQFLENLLKQ